MHILVIGMNYAPERTAGRLRADLCEYLVSIGHQVTVATSFPHYPEWQVYESYRGRAFQTEVINDVSVRRSYTYVPGKPSMLQRIAYDTTFAFSSLLASLPVRKIDVVFAVSPPLQLGITGYLLARLKGARFFLQLIDLVPDAAISLGMMHNSRAIKVARFMERVAYANAEAIVTICQGFADNIVAKGVPREKVHVFGDWVDTDMVHPLDRDNPFRASQGLSTDDFVVLYSGNLGMKQGLETLIEAAALLRDRREIVFLVAGEGMAKQALVDHVRSLGLANVRFLPVQSREALPSMLATADVLALTQKASVVDIVIPSKLLTYMASGRPVVAGVDVRSEAGRLIDRADAGLMVTPEDPAAFAAAIVTLSDDRALARRLGENARSYAERFLAKRLVLAHYEAFFREIDGQPATPSPEVETIVSPAHAEAVRAGHGRS